jgi:hypothetical protein
MQGAWVVTATSIGLALGCYGLGYNPTLWGAVTESLATGEAASAAAAEAIASNAEAQMARTIVTGEGHDIVVAVTNLTRAAPTFVPSEYAWAAREAGDVIPMLSENLTWILEAQAKGYSVMTTGGAGGSLHWLLEMAAAEALQMEVWAWPFLFLA